LGIGLRPEDKRKYGLPRRDIDVCDSGYVYDGGGCPYDALRRLFIERSVWRLVQFTGKERDSESGLDMFGARYYASTMGRFMSPDWSRDPDPIPYADYENPQTLNLYQYVENNPLNATDPDGHAHWGPCPNDSSAQCWTGDKNGEVDQNNGTVWNGKSQQWEQPQPPPSSSWQQFLGWRQQFKDNWDKRIEAHRPPPQKRDDNLQFLQNLNNLMMGMVPITEPLFRDITGKVHGDSRITFLTTGRVRTWSKHNTNCKRASKLAMQSSQNMEKRVGIESAFDGRNISYARSTRN
jgi:RHS repeat-associated protein